MLRSEVESTIVNLVGEHERPGTCVQPVAVWWEGLLALPGEDIEKIGIS